SASDCRKIEEGTPMRDPVVAHNTARREFIIKPLASTCACAIAPSSSLFGQGGTYKPTAKGGLIDVHHHPQPPGFGLGGGGGRGAGGPRGEAGQRGAGRDAWTVQQSIEQMDKFGIAVAILSLTQMGDVVYENTP